MLNKARKLKQFEQFIQRNGLKPFFKKIGRLGNGKEEECQLTIPNLSLHGGDAENDYESVEMTSCVNIKDIKKYKEDLILTFYEFIEEENFKYCTANGRIADLPGKAFIMAVRKKAKAAISQVVPKKVMETELELA